MENEPKISVVVPVYKAEKYLARCVDSLLAQTFRDFEIILIDDGSPDKSGEICDDYAKKDSRVRVIHQENGGVSAARQRGNDEARGEYVIHADPDDWTESPMFAELYAKAKEENADMVFCDFYDDFSPSCNYYHSQTTGEVSAENFLRGLVSQKLHGGCWSKLVRRDFYRTHGVRFLSKISLWEDLCFNVALLRHNPAVAYLPKAFYHYDLYTNPHSIIHQNREQKNIDDQIAGTNFFASVLDGKAFSEELYESKRFVKKQYFHFHLAQTKWGGVWKATSTQKSTNALFKKIAEAFFAQPRGRLRFG